MDDGIAVLREWALLNPSPPSFLSNFLLEDFGGKPISDFTLETINEAPLAEPEKNQSVSEESVEKKEQGEDGNASSVKNNEVGVGRRSSRGGLGERIAARAGFDALKLNTARVRSGYSSSSTSGLPSPYVTIPPGLSPTTLLDSPIFLLNSLTQPSPTTGKLFQGQYTGYGQVPAPEMDTKDVTINDIDSDFFTFTPTLGTSGSYSQDAINQLAMQYEHENQAGTDEVDAQSPSDDLLQDTDDQRLEISSVSLNQPADDGYNWRKYGQKQVKGSEFPRGYYKCTHPYCPSKKKIERSQEGHITGVIYKGIHNHSKPLPHHRTILLASHLQQIDCLENPAPTQLTMQSEAAGNCDGMEASTYVSTARLRPSLESTNAAHLASAVALEDEVTDQANRGSGSIDEDVDANEFELKRRRLDTSLMDMNPASRTSREPRIVVQTTSDIDILDDGYRWRKYGQKVVKGNPNPRSYYKCTSAGCNVRKHVERASHDLKSVITTYEGRHNHDVPVPRNSSSHAASAPSSIRRHGFSKLVGSQFNVQPPLPASFCQEGTKVESPSGFYLGLLGQVGLSKMIPPFQTNQGFRAVGGTGFLPPRGELKVEQAVDQTGVAIPNAMTMYQQILRRLQIES